MKKLFVLLLALACLATLAGCCFEHQWSEADCVTPKTCIECGETEGAPLGHTWKAATCETPKTCETCGTTEGQALGHTWQDATCVVPKNCSVCHITEGNLLEHNWEEATTELPKTCTLCGLTDGKKLDTDPRFTTASTKHLYGKWKAEVVFTGEMLGMPDYFDEVPATVYFEFTKVGELLAEVELHDQFAFLEGMKRLFADILYAEFAAYGLNKEQSDQAMVEAYGMTMTDYVNAAVENIDKDEVFGAMSEDGVYYVGESNTIYSATSWYDEFEPSEYTLENGILIIQEVTLVEDGEPLQWTPVE